MKFDSEAHERNVARLTDPLFLKACELAQIPATPRQASKFNNNYGKAFSKRREAKEALDGGR